MFNYRLDVIFLPYKKFTSTDLGIIYPTYPLRRYALIMRMMTMMMMTYTWRHS